MRFRIRTFMIAVALVALIFGSLLPGFPGLFQAILLLGLGWVSFLFRVMPEVSVHPGSVVVGLGCLVGFAVVVHRFVGWLVAQVQGESNATVWKVRWTAGLVVGLILMFVGGMAAAGGLIQLGRLLTMEENWLQGGRHYGHHRRGQSASNLRQVGLGLLQYSNTFGQFPPGATFDANGVALHGWPTLILPYVDEVARSDAINFSRPWNDADKETTPNNATLTAVGIGIYKNPGVWRVSDQDINRALGYATNAWVVGGDKPRALASITDGLAETILGGEAAGDYKPWGYPVHWRDPNLGINRVASGFGGPFPGGANFMFADGSVRFLRNETPMAVFRALATPDGGEPVALDKLDH